MSDQLPPTGGPGGPEEDRPAALIPSRAARHQKKRGLFRGRSAPPSRRRPRRPRRPQPPRRSRGRSRRRPPSGPGRGRRSGRCPTRRPRRRQAPEEPRRRPALKAPQLRAPKVGDLRGSSLGLAGALVAVVAVLVVAANALPAARPPAAPVTRDPYSARWVCPLLGGQTTAVTIANVGDATASLRTTIRGTGKRAGPDHQGAGRRARPSSCP